MQNRIHKSREVVINLSKILFSVIIPTTDPNRLPLLMRGIDSLRNQDLAHSLFEIIVVSNYAFHLNRDIDISIKIINTDQRILGAKLVIGSVNANSDVLVFLEDDDTFAANKLSTLNKVFSGDNKLGYFKNALKLVSESGSEFHDPDFMDVRRNIYFNNGRELMKSISLKNIGNFHSVVSSITVRKRIIKKISLCLMRINFNSDLALLLSAMDSDFSLSFSVDRLTNYTIHESGTRFAPNISKNEFISRMINLLTDGITMSMELKSCVLSQKPREFLDAILIKQELERMRWQKVEFTVFLKKLLKYLSSLESKNRDIKFLLINILFFIFPEQMKELFMTTFLKKIGQAKKINIEPELPDSYHH